jgi:hypothetical protein
MSAFWKLAPWNFLAIRYILSPGETLYVSAGAFTSTSSTGLPSPSISSGVISFAFVASLTQLYM